MLKSKTNRFWEIDFLRGIAIIMMIIFHFLYDLNFFNFVSIDLFNIPMIFYVYTTASIFLVLVGVSLTLSYSKAKKILTKNQLHIKFIRRGIFIFSLGIIITIVSWFYLKQGFIIFGVLHCIGVSIIVSYPLIRFRVLPLSLGIVFVLVGIYLKTLTFNFSWLLWLGFMPSNFYTVDYFPLMPWLGVVFIGIFLGNTFYENGLRKFSIIENPKISFFNFISFFGRYSLLIYLLHQLVLIGIFTIIKII